MFPLVSTYFQQKLSRAINIKKNRILDKKISNEFVRSVNEDGFFLIFVEHLVFITPSVFRLILANLSMGLSTVCL